MILNLFREYNVTSTFFVQGEVALEYPDLVEEIVKSGHEVGSHDLHHVSPTFRDLKEYEDDVRMSIAIIRKLTGRYPIGYRCPNAEIQASHVAILEKVGFVYDSSVYPCLPIPGFYGRPAAPTQPYHPASNDLSREDQARKFIEFPMAVIPYLRLPAGSGWYLRNFGFTAVKTALAAQLKRGYATFFFHPYEVSCHVPNVPGVPFHTFRGVGKEMYAKIEGLLSYFRTRAVFEAFQSCVECWKNSL
jgi:hypothetical protein